MISIEQLESLNLCDEVIEFSAFVLRHSENGGLPDYKKMDLMEIPNLIPRIWVFDLRNYAIDGHILVNFAGEKFTERHRRQLGGRTMQDVWATDDQYEKLISHYKNTIENKLVSHVKRSAHFLLPDREDRYQNSESLFFPCSSNGISVNWGIGCVDHSVHSTPLEDLFLTFS